MSLYNNLSPLWFDLPSDIQPRLHRCLEQASGKLQHGACVPIFFRADDIGVPGGSFARLVDLFQRHRVPLTLSVVPAWLTRPRWQRLQGLCSPDNFLWCWTQHGWRHLNHELQGKKFEFGPSRPISRKRKDLRLGFQRLSELMGDKFVPAFTPPWNRCDKETLIVLKDLGFKALSRSLGAQPLAPARVPEYPVSVDLHTRKEKDPGGGWQNLLRELQDNLGNGFCGIMIHHQRMNDAAFVFLDLLLGVLKGWQNGRLVHLGTLFEEKYEVPNLRVSGVGC